MLGVCGKSCISSSGVHQWFSSCSCLLTVGIDVGNDYEDVAGQETLGKSVNGHPQGSSEVIVALIVIHLLNVGY